MKYICDSCEKYPCSADETKLMLSCPAYSPKPKPVTNYDRIISKSPEELAAYIDEHTSEAMWCNSPPEECPPEGDCVKCILNWLMEEITDA